MESIAQRWQPIEALGEKMKGLAEQGEWEEIPALELERRALLEAFFQAAISPDESPEVAKRIKALLAEDKRMIEMGSEASRVLLGKLNTFATGRKAKQAYAEHS